MNARYKRSKTAKRAVGSLVTEGLRVKGGLDILFLGM